MMLEDEGFMNEVAFQIKAGVGAAEAMDRVAAATPPSWPP